MPSPDDAQPPTWQLHTDGSALPNPGRMGLGALLVAPDGARHTVSRTAPGTGCNNEAELRALIAALQHARSLGADAVRAHCDSSVVVAQLVEPFAPPVARLGLLVAEARGLLAGFTQASLHWVPQHRNAEADALARAALGLAARAALPAGRKRASRR